MQMKLVLVEGARNSVYIVVNGLSATIQFYCE